VETHGYGNNTRPLGNYVNEWQGPKLFDALDAQMRQYREQNRARD
jgi:hypothetical protein